MALTNYLTYKLIIETLEEDDRGYTLPYLNKMYQLHRSEVNRQRKIEGKKPYKFRITEIKRTTFFNYRVQIYVQFGLLIDTPVENNRYVLTNKEILDTGKKTLREMIDFLVEDEEREEKVSTLIFSKRGRKPKTKVSPDNIQMSFISTDGGDVEASSPLEEYKDRELDKLNMIEFAMAIGEALVIRYGKSRPMKERKDKEDRYVFEPQQLKCINDRWYVAGHLYEYGDKSTSRVVIYDLMSIRLCEDEDVISPKYEVIEGFDINSYLPNDWSEYFNADKVVSLYLNMNKKTIFEIVPFCSAQEMVQSIGTRTSNYRVFVKPDADFFVQYMAYGNEVRAVESPEDIATLPTDINYSQIRYLKELRQKGL